METRHLTCINCPMGCQLTVEMEGQEVLSVTGNSCPRGDMYARTEVVNPVRTVTSSVLVTGGQAERTSVKTANPIPKGMIFDVMKEIYSAVIAAPVKIGDVVIEDVAGTGVQVVATKNIAAR